MSKRFTLDLGRIAAEAPAKTEAPVEKPKGRFEVPVGELAMGRPAPVPHERTTILSVDPKRCRAWAYHDRDPVWYTPERCKDLIDSIATSGQQMPAVGRKLEGDPNFDYEIIVGMRRRFACEYLNKPLKLRLATMTEQQAAVLMHIENADREDISPMERARSYRRQLKEGLFASQDELAQKIQVSKATVAKMVKAAELFDDETIARLFPDPTQVPLHAAYSLAVQLSNPDSRAVILQAARSLARKGGESRSPSSILRTLLTATDRSAKTMPFKKVYNVGTTGRMELKRDVKGKVTITFRDGLQAGMEAEVTEAILNAMKDL